MGGFTVHVLLNGTQYVLFASVTFNPTAVPQASVSQQSTIDCACTYRTYCNLGARKN